MHRSTYLRTRVLYIVATTICIVTLVLTDPGDAMNTTELSALLYNKEVVRCMYIDVVSGRPFYTILSSVDLYDVLICLSTRRDNDVTGRSICDADTSGKGLLVSSRGVAVLKVYRTCAAYPDNTWSRLGVYRAEPPVRRNSGKLYASIIRRIRRNCETKN